jgi:hypothetical protein
MPEEIIVPPTSEVRKEVINGATYELTSNYNGDISLLDLLKQMLKRDMERLECEGE